MTSRQNLSHTSKLDSSAEDWEELTVTKTQCKKEYTLARGGLIRQFIDCCLETNTSPDGDPAAGSDEEHCGQFQHFHYLSLNNKMRESVTTSSSPGSEVSPAGVTSQLNARHGPLLLGLSY